MAMGRCSISGLRKAYLISDLAIMLNILQLALLPDTKGSEGVEHVTCRAFSSGWIDGLARHAFALTHFT